VVREGVEAASRGDDLAGMEHAVQQFADVVVLLIVTTQLSGTQGPGGIFQGRQGQDVYDAEPAGGSLLGRAVGVLFCSQPVDDGSAVGRSKDLVVEGFGPRGERVPGGDEEALLGVSGVGGDEQAAADEGAQVEGGGAVNRGVLTRSGGGAWTGEHDGAAGTVGEVDQPGEGALTLVWLADVEGVDDDEDGFGPGNDVL